MGMPATRHHWTTAEVRALNLATPSWPRYELIDGELLVTQAPAWPHQIAVGELLLLLVPYVDRHDIGVALSAPADVELLPDSITQPDVFVAKALSSEVLGAGAWSGRTELLLTTEVISPSSVRTDRIDKRMHYLKAGVPEYWVVDLDAREVERWTPGRDTPTILSTTLAWHPDGADAPLVIDLVLYFETVWRKWNKLGHP